MLSPAQHVPVLALSRIVDYTVGVLPKREYERCSCDCSLFKSIAAMLALCRHWREAALDRVYQEVWWCIVDGCDVCCKNRCCNRCLPWSLLNAVETGNHSQVKTVNMHWDNSMVLDGSASGIFHTFPFTDLVLPSVGALEFEFEHPGYMEEHSLLSDTHFAEAFCSQIHRIFPNAKSSTISDFVLFQNHLEMPFVCNLLSGLFAHATSVSATPLPENMGNYFVRNTMQMRCLEFGSLRLDSPAIEVIRRNCTSLERLQISSKRHELFTKIVCADDGTSIEYPRMISLETAFYPPQWHRNGATQLDSPAGIPFPNLRKLVCEGGYPFSNDILFSGNSAFLEYLSINLTGQLFSDLKRHSVFSAGRFASLGYISTLTHNYNETDATNQEQIRGAFALGANATTVKHTNGQPCIFGELGVSVGEIGPNIIYLIMPKIKFTLRETLQLISALPYLRQLSTGIHITREMRMNTFAHRLCRGKCYLGWRQTVEYSDDGSDSDASSSASADLYNDYLLSCGQDVQQLKAFMTDHLPNIYTSLGFVDELYTRYYPLSTTLSILDGCTYDGNMVFAQCRMFAILAALCPSVQRVQAGWIDDTSHLTTRSDTNRYISREEIEGTRQHADLVRRLQQLQAV